MNEPNERDTKPELNGGTPPAGYPLARKDDRSHRQSQNVTINVGTPPHGVPAAKSEPPPSARAYALLTRALLSAQQSRFTLAILLLLAEMLAIRYAPELVDKVFSAIRPDDPDR